MEPGFTFPEALPYQLSPDGLDDIIALEITEVSSDLVVLQLKEDTLEGCGVEAYRDDDEDGGEQVPVFIWEALQREDYSTQWRPPGATPVQSLTDGQIGEYCGMTVNSVAEEMHTTYTIPETCFGNLELQFYPCDICEASFTDEQELESHVSDSHCISGAKRNELRGKAPSLVCKERGAPGQTPPFGLGLSQPKVPTRKTQSPPLQCVVCGRIFKQLKCLQRHLWYHTWREGPSNSASDEKQQPVTKGTQNPCPKCGRTFKERKMLDRHRKIYHHNQTVVLQRGRRHPDLLKNISPLRCCECDRHFGTKETFYKHQCFHLRKQLRAFNASGRKSHGVNFYHCQLCALPFTGGLEFEHHIKVNHPEQYRKTAKTKCSAGINKNKRSRALKERDKTVSLEIAEAGFPGFPPLTVDPEERSDQITEPQDSEPVQLSYPCLECGKSFHMQAMLNRHQKMYHIKAEALITRVKSEVEDKCAQTGDTRGTYSVASNTEKRGSGTSDLLHQCGECGRTFQVRKMLDKHQRIYHRDKSTVLRRSRSQPATSQLRCCECDRHFRTTESFHRHQCFHLRKQLRAFKVSGRKSKGVNFFHCQLCTLQFTEGLQFELHVKVTHPEQYKKAAKTLCSAGMTTKTGECGVVNNGKSYSKPPSVTKAQFKITRVKSEIEDKCAQTGDTRGSSSVTANIEERGSGTSDLLHQCGECGRIFKVRKMLDKHQRIYHRDQSAIKCSAGMNKNKSSRALKDRDKTVSLEIAEAGFPGFPPLTVDPEERSAITEQQDSEPVQLLYPCPECGKSFHMQAMLNQHEKMYHIKAEALITRVKSEVEDEYAQTGDTGGSSSVTANIEERGSGKSDLLHQCGECGRIFKVRKMLDRHQRIYHRDQSATKCSAGMNKNKRSRALKDGDKTVSLEIAEAGFPGFPPLTVDPEERSVITEQQDSEPVQLSYPCPECGKSFHMQAMLNRHQKMYHFKAEALITRVKSVVEDKCAQTGDTRGAYSLASNTEKRGSGTSDLLHQCGECGRIFQVRKMLDKHQRIYHRDKSTVLRRRHSHPATILLRCCECDRQFSTTESFHRHQCFHLRKQLRAFKVSGRKSKGVNFFHCQLCTLQFTEGLKFELHVKVTHPEHYKKAAKTLCSTGKTTKTGECGVGNNGKSYSKPASVAKAHLKMTKLKSEVEDKCAQTGDTRGSSIIAANIEERGSGTSDLLHQCGESGRIFKVHKMLDKHQRIYHRDQSAIKCSAGMNRNTRSQALKDRDKTVSLEIAEAGFPPLTVDPEERPAITEQQDSEPVHLSYPCPECGKSFHMQAMLNRHQKMYHIKAEALITRVKSEVEDKCAQTGDTSGAYSLASNTEKRGSGTSDLLHQCGECGRIFKVRKMLDKHQRIYHRDQSTVLPRSRSHPATSPLRCCECDRHFRTTESFHRHQCFHLRKQLRAFKASGRKSKGVNFFHCQLCTLQFTEGLKFELHVKVTHPEQYKKAAKTLCSAGMTTKTGECGVGINGKSYSKPPSVAKAQFKITRVKSEVEDKCAQTGDTRGSSSVTANIEERGSGTSDLLHQCGECGRIFKVRKMLDKHQRICHRDQSAIKCSAGMNQNKRSRGLKDGGKSVSLEIAEAGFPGFPPLTVDPEERSAITEQQDSEPVQLSYPCPECGKSFHMQAMLNRHQKMYHFKAEALITRVKSEVEDKCAQTGDTRGSSSVTANIEERGSGTSELLHQCDECGRIFKVRKMLDKHQQIYHRDQSAILRRSRSHPTVSLLTCCECDRQFSTKDNFYKHQCFHLRKQLRSFNASGRKSDGMKFYHCQLCALTFTGGLEFEHHIKVTHLEQYRKTAKTKCSAGINVNTRSQALKDRDKTVSLEIAEAGFPPLTVNPEERPAIAEQQNSEPVQLLYPCPECGKSFHMQAMLSRHQEMYHIKAETGLHTGNNIFAKYKCHKCEKTFRTRKILQKHNWIHRKNKALITRVKSEVEDKCAQTGDSRGAYSVAANTEKRGSGTSDLLHQCGECGRIFQVRKLLDKHHRIYHRDQSIVLRRRRIHPAMSLLRCCECDRQFGTTESFHRHQCFHLRKQLRAFKVSGRKSKGVNFFHCQLCTLQFTEGLKFELHVIVTHPEQYKKAAKTLCSAGMTTKTGECGVGINGKSYSKPPSVAKAQFKITRVKSEIEDKCAQTGDTRGSSSVTANIEERGSGTSDLLHQCGECGRIFKVRKMLDKHQRICHRDQSAIKCSAGMNQNKRSRALKDGGKTVSLEIAEAGFPGFPPLTVDPEERSAITEQQDSEPVQLSYPCPECGKSFHMQALLNRHQKMYHFKAEALITRVKSEVEDKCAQTGDTRGSSSVTANIEERGSGTSELLHQCDECGRIFKVRKMLDKHQQIYHRDQSAILRRSRSHPTVSLLTCCECDRQFSTKDNFYKHQCFHLRKQLRSFNASGRKSDGMKFYHCQLCALTFTGGLEFEHHIKVTHLEQYRKTAKTKCSAGINMNTRSLALKDRDKTVSLEIAEAGFPPLTVNPEERPAIAEQQNSEPVQLLYPCPECGKSFHMQAMLSKHQEMYHIKAETRLHSGNNMFAKYKCHKCEKTFRTRKMLQKHNWIHRKNKVLITRVKSEVEDKCAQTGDSRGAYSVAANTEKRGSGTSDLLHQCGECGRIFQVRKLLDKHHRIYHRDQSTVLRRRRSHPAMSLLRCCECDRQFGTTESFHRHQCFHLRKQLRAFKASGRKSKGVNFFHCQLCTLQFAEGKKFELHVKVTHPKHYKKAAKTLCSTGMTTKTGESRVGNNGKSYSKPPSVAKAHVKITRVKSEVEKKCAQTGDTRHSSSVATNIEERGSGTSEVLHQCGECGRTFQVRKMLDKHQRVYHRDQSAILRRSRSHPTVSLLRCCECDRHFSTKETFYKHQCFHLRKQLRAFNATGRMSHGVKFYHCQLCALPFTGGLDFEHHIKVSHPELYRKTARTKCSAGINKNKRSRALKDRDKTVSMEIAEAGFPGFPPLTVDPEERSDQITEQQDSELVQLLYPCTDCGKSFHMQAMLSRHQQMYHIQAETRLHNSNNSYANHKCPKCEKTFRTRKMLQKHNWMHRKRKVLITRVKSEVEDKCAQTGDTRGSCSVAANTEERGSGTSDLLHQCGECGRTFQVRKMLDKHQRIYHRDQSTDLRRSRSHPTKSLLTCCECDRHFSTTESFHRHQCFHLRKQLRAFKALSRNSKGVNFFHCQLCTLQFTEGLKFELHVQLTHPEQYKKAAKTLCSAGKTTKTGESGVGNNVKTYGKPPSVAKAHVKITRVKSEVEDKCAQTGDTRGSSSVTANIEERGSGTSELLHQCGECGRIFKVRKMLDKHQRIYHRDQSAILRRSRSHPTVSLLTCCECDRHFSTTESFHRHQCFHLRKQLRAFKASGRKSKGVNFFHCQLCTLQFTEGLKFELHVKVTHPEQYKKAAKTQCSAGKTTKTGESGVGNNVKTYRKPPSVAKAHLKMTRVKSEVEDNCAQTGDTRV